MILRVCFSWFFSCYRKRNEKLDWMYAAPGQVDREEYLLGKVIDKKVDPLADNEEVGNSSCYIRINDFQSQVLI